MRRPVLQLLVIEALFLLSVPFAARAQLEAPTPLEEVDPDTGELGVWEDTEDLQEAPVLPPPITAPPPAAPPPSPNNRQVVPAAAQVPERESARPAEKAPSTPPEVAPAKKAPLPLAPVRLTSRTEADLAATWERWRKATAELDHSGAQKALAQLLELKRELGIAELPAQAVAVARAAKARGEASDLVGRIELAGAARELSPGLPFARFAVAQAYFASDPSEVGRWGGALLDTAGAFWNDPRYLRPVVGDLVAALLAALVATAAAVVGLLFVRRLRYFLHDFHHLFPRGAARWQTAPLALLLISLPLVFRLGLIPVLAVLFAAVALYLEWRERIVGAVAIALVGLGPLFAELAAEGTTFAGTTAEELYRLEQGGLAAADAATVLRARVQTGAAGFEELFVLGRYELRRGQVEAAGELFKKAALLRGDHPRLLVNLGNARFGLNDLEGAATHYARASQLDPALAAASWNLSRVHYRRAQTLQDADQALELEKAQTAQALAQQQDPALLGLLEPATDADLNRHVFSPGLDWAQLAPVATVRDGGQRVADQVAWRLMGTTATPLALLLPALLALAAVGLGALRSSLLASRGCARCGGPVCHRCDKELPFGPGLCSQCVNVFARKGAVAPQVKVRKQLEVDRYERRQERLGWLLGILCSGAGHLFRGFPVRGALFAFVFLFAVFLGVFRDGVLRAPYGELPLAFRLLPAALTLVVVYFLSLRSLRKAQAG